MQSNTSPVHFISGLPRSGSTLLSAILRQNPKLCARISSPLALLFSAVLPKMSGTSEYATFFSDERRRRVLEGLFKAYHHDELEHNKLIFDTNRTWTAKLPLLNWLSINVYTRVKDLMDSEHGLVGLAWVSLREAWFGEHADKLIVIRYESLVRDPSSVLGCLYERLGEELFDHDFENVQHREEEFDLRLGMPDLHTVRRRVEKVERTTILPPDLFMKHVDMNFWENEKLNTRKVVVL